MAGSGAEQVAELIDTVDPVVDSGHADAFETVEDYRTAIAAIRSAAVSYYTGTDLTMDDASYDALMARVSATESARPQWRTADSPTGSVADRKSVV